VAVPLTGELARARLTGSLLASLTAPWQAGRAIVRAWNILHAAHQASAESKKWVDGRQALRTLPKPLHPNVLRNAESRRHNNIFDTIHMKIPWHNAKALSNGLKYPNSAIFHSSRLKFVVVNYLV
jgi:hypothetical protein